MLWKLIKIEKSEDFELPAEKTDHVIIRLEINNSSFIPTKPAIKGYFAAGLHGTGGHWHNHLSGWQSNIQEIIRNHWTDIIGKHVMEIYEGKQFRL